MKNLTEPDERRSATSESTESEARDDGALVREALRDRDRFALIVRRYAPPLSRYLGRLLGASTQSTEDVLQDVFIKVYLNLNDYDQTRPFSPWIYRIAHNEAMSFLRRRRREPYTIAGDEGKLLLERVLDGFDVHDFIDQSRLDNAVRAALGDLDSKYRGALVLRFLEDKSYREISEILRLPMGSVATLINRGKKRLKRNLERAGIDR